MHYFPKQRRQICLYNENTVFSSLAPLKCGYEAYITFINAKHAKSLFVYRDKGKVHPRTDHKGPREEYRYSSALSLTSALDEGG